MSKHVLVTGAAGFVGSHVVERILVDTDWKVACADPANPVRLLDLLKRRPVEGLRLSFGGVLTEGITDVIHCASEANVSKAIQSPREMIQSNVNGTLDFLEHFRLNPITGRFLLLSTNEVYGPATGEWGKLHEWGPIVPTNPYSAGKACQEAIAISYWRTYGLPLVIANTMNVYGERQQPEKIVPKCVAAALNGTVLPVWHPGSRAYMHADDVADALIFLLKADLRAQCKTMPPRYNVCETHEISNLDLADMIGEMVGKPIAKEIIPSNAIMGYDSRNALSAGKLAGLGFRIEHKFEQRLEQTVKWYMENPEWLKAS